MFAELLDDISTDARRAGDIIHGIHRLVRKGERSRKPINPNEIIADVLRLLHSDLLGRAPGVAQFDHELARGDARQVETSHPYFHCSDGRICRGSVRDYGVGLPKDDPDRIFTQFFSTKPNGMGMG